MLGRRHVEGVCQNPARRGKVGDHASQLLGKRSAGHSRVGSQRVQPKPVSAPRLPPWAAEQGRVQNERACLPADPTAVFEVWRYTGARVGAGRRDNGEK